MDYYNTSDDFSYLEKVIDPLLKKKFGDKDSLLWKLMYFCVFESLEEKKTLYLARVDFKVNNKELQEIKKWLINTGLYKALRDWYDEAIGIKFVS